MSQQSGRHKSRAVWAAVGISVVAHLAIVLVVLPPELAKLDEPDEREREFEVSATYEDEELEEAELDEKEAAEVDEKEREEEQEQDEPEEEQKEEEKEQPDTEVDRKIVQQETNEEEPDQADYLSQEANKTDEQTRDEEATDQNAEPGEDVPDEIEEPGGEDEEAAEGESEERDEVASAAEPSEDDARKEEEQSPPEPDKEPEEKPREEPPEEPEEPQDEEPEEEAPERDEPTEADEETAEEKDEALEERDPGEDREVAEDSPVVKDEADKKDVDPQELFGKPSKKDYDDVFGEEDEKIRGEVQEKEREQGRKMLSGWKERKKAVRASLENHANEVKPGNHTSVNAKKSVYADYIGRIHRKIHRRWGDEYLPHLDRNMPRGHELSDPTLKTKLEFVVEADSGEVDAVNIVESSGQTMFDAEAIDVGHAVGPHEDPPDEIVSPDGKVYIHWTFWRDNRQCGPFGASVYLVDEDGERTEHGALE